MRTINPYSNSTIQEFKTLDKEGVDQAIENTQIAFEGYHSWSYIEKKEHLLLAAEELEQNKSHYAALITMEMGKLTKEAEAEIEKCAWVCKYYAENGEELIKKQLLKSDASESYITYEPLGILLTVMPWNYPFWQFFRCAAPALLLGNALLLKHASNVPQCALAIQEVFSKAGFPEDLVKTLLIDSSQVEHVIKHEHIKAVTLTGSEKAGSAVAAIAGKHIKKTVLELGGSDPFIVLDDANVSEAAKIGTKARFMNCGQSCIAAKRFIVHEQVYDEFLEAFKAEVAQLNMGDPTLESISIGPMSRQDLCDELDEQVKETVNKGAHVVIGGHKSERTGAFYAPTILTNIPEGSPAFNDELFGPVASVFKVKSESEAIDLANATKFGLGASLWTQNIERAKRLVPQIQSGAVFVNGMVKSDPRLPFGGVKASGYGRELSEVGLKEFANIKTVWIA